MDAGVRCYGEELLVVLSAATAVLKDLPARIPRLTGADLDAVLPAIDGRAAVASAGRFTVTAEAVERGEVTASQAGSTAQRVTDRCPALDAREAGLVAKAVRELTAPCLVVARAAVEEGRLSVSAGCVVAAEERRTGVRGELPGLVRRGGDPDHVEVGAGLAQLLECGDDGPLGEELLWPANEDRGWGCAHASTLSRRGDREGASRREAAGAGVVMWTSVDDGG